MSIIEPQIGEGGVVSDLFDEADAGLQTLSTEGSFTATNPGDPDDPLSADHTEAATAEWSGGDVADLPADTIAVLSSVDALLLLPDYDDDTNVLTVDWSYDSGDVDLNFLGDGETLKLTFPVTVSNGTGGTVPQNIVLTVTGTNDDPVIAASAPTRDVTGAVDEIADLSASPAELTSLLATTGVVTFTDVDLSDEPTATTATRGADGGDTGPLASRQITSSTLANSYVLTNAQKNALLDAFSLDADQPVFDHDGNSATAGAGTVAWTYSILDSAVDFLGANDVVNLAFLVTVNDGNGGTVTETVTIAVTGTNDAPVIAASAPTRDVTGAVDELADLSVSPAELTSPLATTGIVTFKDVDLSDAPTAATAARATDGGDAGLLASRQIVSSTLANGYALTNAQKNALLDAFSINAGNGAAVTSFDHDGTSATAGAGTVAWTYSILDSAVDFLGANDVVNLAFLVTISDGNGGAVTDTVTIAVTGTDDAPVIAGGPVTVGASGPELVSLTEVAGQTGQDTPARTASGTFSFSDVDLSDAHTSSDTQVSAVWTEAGAKAIPAATLTALAAAGTLQTSISNASTGDGAGVLSWSFSLADRYLDFLAVGETLTVGYEVTVNDGNGGTDTETITIVLHGTNDAPVAVDDVPNVAERADSVVIPATATGNVITDLVTKDSDVDLNDTLVVYAVAVGAAGTLDTAKVGQQIQGIYGKLTLSASGAYSYVFLNTNALIAGETGVDAFHYQISDGHGGFDDATLTFNVAGTDLDLTITGADASPFIAQRGNDIVRGRDGIADTIYGRAGNDTLHGFGGNDTLYGEAGNDTLWGGNGNNQAAASGNDTLYGGTGDDTLHGLDGDDILWGGNGDLSVGSGNDTLYGEGGNDTLQGEDGNDTLWGGDGDDTLAGGDGNDEIHGGADKDTITGGAGKDTLFGDAGDDRIWGQGDDDEIHGGDGKDILVGGMGGDAKDPPPSGNDTLFGDAGDDELYGENGNDVLWGGAGSDIYSGGTGNDILYFEGDGASDTAWGGPDSDTFVFNRGFGVDTIKDFLAVGANGDKINLSAIVSSYSSLTIKQVGNNVEITGLGTGNKIVLEVVNRGAIDATDFIFTGGATIIGTDNADTIDATHTVAGQAFATAFADTIKGNGGADVMNGGGGADVLFGGAAADVFVFDSAALTEARSVGRVFDRVADYNQGNGGGFNAGEGDKLDLSAILGAAYNHGSGQPVSALVRAVASGADTLLQVDPDGAANGAVWTTIARLSGVGSGNSLKVVVDATQPAGSSIVVGTAPPPGDFDGDGKSDLLWRHQSGVVAIWEMDGAVAKGGAVVSTVTMDWKIVDTGDFDGDGKADLLWRHDSGVVAIWEMDGYAAKAAAVVGPTLPASWKFVDTGDFDGDGKSDILWRQDNGAVTIWKMDAVAAPVSATVATLTMDWKLADTGDFNGDGKADILWRHDSGIVSIWEMDGFGVIGAAVAGTLANPWSIADTGDFNGDGKSDILWRNGSSGAVMVWQMDGLASTGSATVGTLSTAWSIADTGDYNGDGRTDLLWRNGTTGDTVIWEMNGLGAPTSLTVGNVAPDWFII